MKIEENDLIYVDRGPLRGLRRVLQCKLRGVITAQGFVLYRDVAGALTSVSQLPASAERDG